MGGCSAQAAADWKWRDYPSHSEESETRYNGDMSKFTRTQRRYDHRLRELGQTSGDVELATRHGVPRSTARGWLTKRTTEVVSLDVLERDTVRLQLDVILLRRQIARLVSVFRLVVVVLKVSGVSFTMIRCSH